MTQKAPYTSKPKVIAMNKLTIIQILVVLSLQFCLLTSLTAQKRDKVPNAKIAIEIAESAWLPVFGEDTVIKQRPYTATLVQDSIWHVVGNISREDDIVEYDEEGRIIKAIIYMGGELHAYINKRDATVIKIYHTR